jgi:hypothetical protein
MLVLSEGVCRSWWSPGHLWARVGRWEDPTEPYPLRRSALQTSSPLLNSQYWEGGSDPTATLQSSSMPSSQTKKGVKVLNIKSPRTPLPT